MSALHEPFYREAEANLALYFADSFALMAAWHAERLLAGNPEPLVDITVTDLPYDVTTVKGARRQGAAGPERLIAGHFDAFTVAQAREALRLAGLLSRTWVVATMDIEHLSVLRKEPPYGLEFVRDGVWVKDGSAPQYSGDRPGMGHEAVGIFHRVRAKGERLKWFGGGRSAVFRHPVVRGESNPTAKPVSLMREFIVLFCPPGGTVLDPFVGTGATARAAKDVKRGVVGIDADRVYLDDAALRAKQEVFPWVE